jgi:hypothetical protein
VPLGRLKKNNQSVSNSARVNETTEPENFDTPEKSLCVMVAGVRSQLFGLPVRCCFAFSLLDIK